MTSAARKSAEARFEALAKTNPLFGSAKLKLGTFCTNVSNAATMATVEGAYEATWQNVLTVSQLADQMRFEAIVPLGRWRGFGGVTQFNEDSFETMTFSAAVTASTTYPSVFATVHVPAMHPILAAKQGTTIDHVGGGRFTLNLVTGWNRREIEMFGSPLLEHEERYAVAEEWIALVKMLWSSDVERDFDGKYFQVKAAQLRPRPIQPYPALMNASGSAVGKKFAAKHFDIIFTSFHDRDPAVMRAHVDSYRTFARQEFGRELKVWVTTYMFLGDTEKDAQRRWDLCTGPQADWVAAERFMTELGVNSKSVPPDVMKKVRNDMVAGYGGFRMLGDKNQVVDDLKLLAGTGVDGVLITWPAFVDDMRRFKDEVHPLLVQEGLR